MLHHAFLKQHVAMAQLRVISRDLPPVYSWLRTRGLVKKKGTKPFTHLATCARLGPIVVPHDMLNAFYENYDKDVKAKKLLFISEEATDNHILFFDLDFPLNAESKWDDSVTWAVVNSIQRAICTVIYTDVHPRFRSAVVLVTEVTPTNKKSEDTFKFGIHIYWPDLYCNVESHIRVRSVLLATLKHDFPDKITEKVKLIASWNKILDVDRVMKPKLRMFGSNKMDYCNCPKKKNAEDKCPHYGGRGDAGRSYRMALVITGLGKSDQTETTKCMRDSLYLLKRISLRREPAEGKLSPTHFPDEIEQMLKQDAKDDNVILEHQKEGKGQVVITDENPKKEIIRKVVYLYMHTTDITSIKFMKKSKSYVIQTNSRLCFNVGRKHHSNHCVIQVLIHLRLFLRRLDDLRLGYLR